MDHDLRIPTLVLAGAWNPAIFSVQWIATHLFGKKAGEMLNVANVASGTGEQSLYVDQIGVGALFDRLNLYCNVWAERKCWRQ